MLYVSHIIAKFAGPIPKGIVLIKKARGLLIDM